MRVQAGHFLIALLILILPACSKDDRDNNDPEHLAEPELKITYGTPIAVSTKKIDPESVRKPVVRLLRRPLRVAPPRHQVRLTETPAVVRAPETPTVLTPAENGVLLPKEVPARGKSVPALQPPPVPARPLQKKDDAITEIRALDITQGMNAAGVWSLFEDSRGNLWIGTFGGGVSRYDGSNFTHYTIKEGLSNNFIRSIVEDRNGHLWFGTWGGGVNRYDGKNFTRFTTGEGLCGNGVLAMLEDRRGHLWFGTDDGGLCRYDGESFLHFTKEGGVPDNYVSAILEDSRGHLWFGLHDNGICHYDPDRGRFSFTHYTAKDGLIDNRVRSILEDRQGNLWFGTLEGVSRFDGRHFTSYSMREGLGSNDVTSMLEDDQGNLWFGTDPGGVVKFDGEYFTPFTTGEGLSHNNILCMLKDSYGSLWFGTWSAGVNRYSDINLTYFTDEQGQIQKDIRAILEDSRGSLWFGTGGGGVIRYNGNGFTNLTTADGLNSNNVISLLEDRQGRLWFGHNNYGVSRLEGDRLTIFPPEAGLHHASVVSMLEDSRGDIWMGGMKSKITRFDGRSFTHYELHLGLEVSGNCIFTMLEDRRGHLWFGTWAGVIRYDGQRFINFTTRDGLGNNYIMSCMEDSLGNIWFGTWGGGLSRFTPLEDGAGVFTNYTTDDGLNDNWVTGIVEDRQHNLWVNTFKGFTVLIPQKKAPAGETSLQDYQWLTFDQENGMERTNFSWNNGICLDRRNRLWWGTLAGPTMLDLNRMKLPENVPQIRLNTIEIGRTFVDYRRLKDEGYQKRLPFGKALAGAFAEVPAFQNYPERLNLPHVIDHLTFHFAAVDWSAPQKLTFSYQLEGLDKSWSAPSPENKAEYRNLAPGTYTFKVKAIGAARRWSDTFTYTFSIRPPWWRTWWAYLSYLVLIGAALYSLYRFQLKRKLAAAETVRLKEMDAVKTRLYTNITHEFRTPLTVISGMARQIAHHPERWLKEGLTMISRNSEQLLNLVNQMLDLARLESNTLGVNYIQGDVAGYLRYLTESFHSYAATKNIALYFRAEPEAYRMDYDPEKVQTIFRNLVGNAIKFTTEGGEVWIRVEGPPQDGLLRICVTDNGPGIPPAHLPHIFDRFYQVDDSSTRRGEGTGIGLALTRELVKLLGGRIEVESRVGEGATFIVWLPVKREAPAETTRPAVDDARQADDFVRHETDEVFTTAHEGKSNRPLALIIEDNPDVVRYLRSCIQADYRVEVAGNGGAGIEKALEIVPDIIISDVMMPEKDGFEVCATLKQDERTSHIPIILLTAKADDTSRREGLRHGADAYLIKPFDKEELEIRLRKLIELRQRLKERYGNVRLEDVDVRRETDPELLFLKKLEAVILEHLSDENFRVEPDLCRAMTMSRPQLYNKLKALNNQSPSEFMRHIRMRQARKLLQVTGEPIGAIAAQVGFKDHSYFTKVYFDTFAETPSDTRNRLVGS